MSSQQYQQQRRKFAAAFLAFIFILAAVDIAEAGKKEKPGKQLSHREMLPWMVPKQPSYLLLVPPTISNFLLMT